jgi:uridine phosphorylase
MTDCTAYIHERMGGQCQAGDIAPYILVPGSEKRVRRFAELWDTAREVAHHYEFLVYSGTLGSTPISACSTGCGARSTSIAVDEMTALGAHTFIRAGVTGAIQPDIKVGDLIISSGAVRMERTSEHYVFVEYPATAHFEVVAALASAAQRRGYPYHIGISATAATFSAGEGSSCFGGYRFSGMDHIEADMRAARVLDWDNETATLLTLCSLYGLRAGRISTVVDDPDTGTYNPVGEERLVQTALDAIRILAAWDQEKASRSSRFTLPPYPDR